MRVQTIFSMSVLVATALFLLLPGPAAAHDPNITFAAVALEDGRQVTARFVIKGTDLVKDSGVQVIADGETELVDPVKVLTAANEIIAYLGRKVRIANPSDVACKIAGGTVQAQEDAVVIGVRWDCLNVRGELIYTNELLLDAEVNARQLLRIGRDAATQPRVMSAALLSASLTGPQPPYLTLIGQYVTSGIEHIFVGFDHIAFLIALLLWARRFWDLVKIVTAFTLAHSITLTLSVLDLVTIPNDIAEALIAASIVYVAVENYFRREVPGRWKVTFILGLIHGFGFASVLKVFGLPDQSLASALAAFNIGVEIGQVMIVAACVPFLLLLDRAMAPLGTPHAELGQERRPAIVYLASTVILVVGLFWLAERTVLA